MVVVIIDSRINTTIYIVIYVVTVMIITFSKKENKKNGAYSVWATSVGSRVSHRPHWRSSRTRPVGGDEGGARDQHS